MIESIEVRVKALEDEVKDIKKTCSDTSERLIRIEEKLENSICNAIDIKEFSNITNAINLLNKNVSDLIAKLDTQAKDIKEHDDRLYDLEMSDGAKAKKVLTFIATTIGSLVLGLAFGIIMKGGI